MNCFHNCTNHFNKYYHLISSDVSLDTKRQICLNPQWLIGRFMRITWRTSQLMRASWNRFSRSVLAEMNLSYTSIGPNRSVKVKNTYYPTACSFSFFLFFLCPNSTFVYLINSQCSLVCWFMTNLKYSWSGWGVYVLCSFAGLILLGLLVRVYILKVLKRARIIVGAGHQRKYKQAGNWRRLQHSVASLCLLELVAGTPIHARHSTARIPILGDCWSELPL